jgi:succinyl-CoA synthetase beta subunit
MGLLQKYGVNVPAGEAAKTPQEAVNVAKKFEKSGIVIKAQVLAGGRGKGHFDNGFKGGVHLLKTATEAGDVAKKILGAKLITKQTGKAGKPCDTVYICEKKLVKKEFYFAILMDRATAVIPI